MIKEKTHVRLMSLNSLIRLKIILIIFNRIVIKDDKFLLNTQD